jgi:hypothetical protein
MQRHRAAQARLPAARRARVVLDPLTLDNRGRRECRTLGASAAARAVVESTRVSHHGHTGNTGIPRAMVLRLISCSPR